MGARLARAVGKRDCDRYQRRQGSASEVSSVTRPRRVATLPWRCKLSMGVSGTQRSICANAKKQAGAPADEPGHGAIQSSERAAMTTTLKKRSVVIIDQKSTRL